jgi:hypothetical protein
MTTWACAGILNRLNCGLFTIPAPVHWHKFGNLKLSRGVGDMSQCYATDLGFQAKWSNVLVLFRGKRFVLSSYEPITYHVHAGTAYTGRKYYDNTGLRWKHAILSLLRVCQASASSSLSLRSTPFANHTMQHQSICSDICVWSIEFHASDSDFQAKPGHGQCSRSFPEVSDMHYHCTNASLTMYMRCHRLH